MKKLLFVAIFCLAIALNSASYAQDIYPEEDILLYTFFINIVPGQFNVPLIGFVNVGKGDHASVNIGFVNANEKNFKGLQSGFVNVAGGSLKGVQSGFVNAAGNSLKGIQAGFVNAAGGDSKGVQAGFVNVTGKKMKGVQAGFVNNSRGGMKGPQVGFVNNTDNLKGLQLGFVNVSDSLENGIPVGFVSVVRKGGYKALELYFSEIYPVNLSFKLGIPALYTSFTASLNPNLPENFYFGLGIGSIIPLSYNLYLNPEILTQNPFSGSNRQLTSFVANLGISLSSNFQLTAGPSLIWDHGTLDADPFKPVFLLYEEILDDNNSLYAGFRVGLRYRL